MTVDGSFAEAASIERRLRFANGSDSLVNTAFHRTGLSPLTPRLGGSFSNVANLLYDSTEWVRNGFHLSYPGQAHIAALKAPVRVSQTPTHRGYWYDPRRHALVGMQLGIDLIPSQGKYFLVETNLGVGLMQKRRALYRSTLDPFIREMLAAAKHHDFKRIVFYRTHWSKDQLAEFDLAQRESRIEVIGASSPITHRGAPHPMVALPEELPESSIHVIHSGQRTPLSLFFHDKLWTNRWLQQTSAAHPSEAQLLTPIPTHERLMLPAEPQDPRWPNLVVKLASRDRGKFVLMGRFRSEAHARDELRLDGPDEIPRVFDISLRERLQDRFFPRLQAIYQPYIPAQLVDNALRKARLNIFVSPLFDRFLSAHYIVSGQKVAKRAPEGLIKDAGPYSLSVSSFGGRFENLDGDTESEIRKVANEFGRLANLATQKKFVLTPD